MRFIILGAGAVGTSLAQSLVRDQHDVVLIERDEYHIDRLASTLDMELVLGDGCQPEVLKRAGIQSADYIIAVADIDEINITACLISKLLNPSAKRIARIRDINFQHSDISDSVRESYFDLIINPDQAAADHLLHLFRVPGAKEVIDFCNDLLRVIALPISENSPIANQKLEKVSAMAPDFPLLIIAILRDGTLIVPTGKTVIRHRDLVYFLIPPDRTGTLFEFTGRRLVAGRSAIVWGEGALAKAIMRGLEDQGTGVKVIVPPEGNAEELIDVSKNALVLRGDGKDQALLVEENIHETDAFFAVSNDEEENILGSLLAKKLGCRMAVALVNKSTYLPLVSAIGVDVVVSSRLAAASAIFQHLHSEKFVSEISLRDLGAGFLEVLASEDMPITGKQLKEISVPRGILFAALIRNGEVSIPTGETTIGSGDHVVLFVTAAAEKKVEKLLGMKLDFFI